jgi:hypothetical protein
MEPGRIGIGARPLLPPLPRGERAELRPPASVVGKRRPMNRGRLTPLGWAALVLGALLMLAPLLWTILL